jgi:hypothetical protein
MHSIQNNAASLAGEAAIAEAISTNHSSALSSLIGITLARYNRVLGLPADYEHKSNEQILCYLKQRRLSDHVKSASGGYTS